MNYLHRGWDREGVSPFPLLFPGNGISIGNFHKKQR
jgi:hypothetical protein